MPEVMSPGYAFSSAFEQQLLGQQQAQQEAARLKIEQDREARMAAAQVEELRQGQEALAIRRDEANRQIRDDLRTQTVNDVKMLRMGDIPDPELVQRARQFHVPLRLAPMGAVLEQAPPPSLAAPGQENLPPARAVNSPRIGPAPGSVLGTPEEERKVETDQRRAALATRLKAAKPGSPEERAILIEAAELEGHMPSAAELRTEAPDTAATERAKYLQLIQKQHGGQKLAPEESNFVFAYEHEKGLVPGMTAQAAGGRQGTAEDFQMRKDGLDKIEKLNTDYSKSSAKAQSIIDVVNAAKQGNKEAGGVQNLLVAFGLTGVEGLNRVNMPEIQTVAGVGDILTRMRNRIRMLTQGQALTPELQEDAIQLAKILQGTQRKNYMRQFNSTKKLYGLGEDVEPLEDEPLGHTGDTSNETPAERKQRLLEGFRKPKGND